MNLLKIFAASGLALVAAAHVYAQSDDFAVDRSPISVPFTARQFKGQKILLYSNSGHDEKSCRRSEHCEVITEIDDGDVVWATAPALSLYVNGKLKDFSHVEYVKEGRVYTGYVLTEQLDHFNCPECVSAHNVTNQVLNLQALTLTATREEPPRKTVKLDRNFNNRCKQFINDKGELGKWGEKVLIAIEKADRPYRIQTGRSCFQQDLRIHNLCPNYNRFNHAERQLFWVYVFTSIAQDESSCDPDAVNEKATYGRGEGLLMMEYDNKLRAASNRDRNLCKAGQPVNTKNIDFQFECAASIIRDINCQSGKELNWKQGYWQELRPKRDQNGRLIDGKITKLVKGFPLCKGKL